MSIAKCPIWFVCFSNLPFCCQEIKQTDATLFEGLHYIRCLTHHLLDLQQQLTAMHYSQSRADSNWWCRGAGNLSFLTLSLPNTCNTVLLHKGLDLLRKIKEWGVPRSSNCDGWQPSLGITLFKQSIFNNDWADRCLQRQREWSFSYILGDWSL